MNYYVITRNMTKEVGTTNTSFSGVKRMSTTRRGKPPSEKDKFVDSFIGFWNAYWSNAQEKPREIELNVQDDWMIVLENHIKELLEEFRAKLSKRHVWVLRVILAFSLLDVPLNLSDAEWLYNELCALGFKPALYRSDDDSAAFMVLLAGNIPPSNFQLNKERT
ncbi:MAG: hypothetical protein ACTSUB_09870 [Candidatus Thorarchaeota archaeon]